MNLASALAAAGMWPAVPLTGYLIFARAQRLREDDSLPVPAAVALTAVAGLAAWSVPLLAAAGAGVYRPAYVGAAAWGVALIGLATLLRDWSAPRRGQAANREVRTADDAVPSALVAARSRRRDRHPAPVPVRRPAGSTRADRVSDRVLAVGLLLAAALYLGFPTESIYGGRDEGVYANHAVYLANHGRLDVPYPWAPEDGDVLSTWMGFPGFYNTSGTMTVQFGHLFPLWLAQAYATLGPDGLFRLNGVFALLSLAAFYGVCRMAVPSPLALAATLFLAFNPSQLWIARITLSEPLTQLFIWSGLLLLLQALRDRRRALGGWAGAFLGASAFVRFDGLIMVPLLFLSHVVWELFDTAEKEQGEHGAAATASAAWSAVYHTALPISALALASYAVTSTPYFLEVSALYMAPLATASAATLSLRLLARSGIIRRIRPTLTGRVVFGALVAAVVVGCIYAYWWRPQPSATPQWKYEPGYSFDVSRDYAQDSLVNLAAYLSPFVLWAAIAGWLIVLSTRIRRGRDGFLIPALVIIGCCSALYLWNPAVYPDHFWGVRRFVPVVIPGFVLCAAIALAEVTRRLPTAWALVVLGAALAFLTGFTWQAGRILFFFTEDRGLYAQFRALAERLPPDEVIVTHGDNTWVTPLYAAFDRRVVPIDIKTAEGSTLWRQWAARQKARGQPAYLLVEIDKPSADPRKIVALVLSRVFIQPTVYPLPTNLARSEWRLELYKFPPS